MKYVNMATAYIIVSAIWMGVLCPYLVSSNSTLLAVIGLLFIVLWIVSSIKLGYVVYKQVEEDIKE